LVELGKNLTGQAEVGDQRAEVGVGSKNFVEGIKEKLGIRAKGRKVEGSRDLYHLRESQTAYNSDFTPENSDLRAENICF
jgi:hypothetical protein